MCACVCVSGERETAWSVLLQKSQRGFDRSYLSIQKERKFISRTKNNYSNVKIKKRKTIDPREGAIQKKRQFDLKEGAIQERERKRFDPREEEN